MKTRTLWSCSALQHSTCLVPLLQNSADIVKRSDRGHTGRILINEHFVRYLWKHAQFVRRPILRRSYEPHPVFLHIVAGCVSSASARERESTATASPSDLPPRQCRQTARSRCSRAERSSAGKASTTRGRRYRSEPSPTGPTTACEETSKCPGDK